MHHLVFDRLLFFALRHSICFFGGEGCHLHKPMSEEKTVTMAAVSVEAVFKVRYKNHQYDVEVCYNPGKSVAGVKELIVVKLKSNYDGFDSVKAGYLTLKTLDGVVIMEDEMPEGKKFFADLDERLVDEQSGARSNPSSNIRSQLIFLL